MAGEQFRDCFGFVVELSGEVAPDRFADEPFGSPKARADPRPSAAVISPAVRVRFSAGITRLTGPHAAASVPVSERLVNARSRAHSARDLARHPARRAVMSASSHRGRTVSPSSPSIVPSASTRSVPAADASCSRWDRLDHHAVRHHRPRSPMLQVSTACRFMPPTGIRSASSCHRSPTKRTDEWVATWHTWRAGAASCCRGPLDGFDGKHGRNVARFGSR